MSIDNALLERYAALKKAESDIKKQLEELKPQVLVTIREAGADEVELQEVGKFVLVPKRTWKYPPAIVTMESELKKAKEVAEAKGEATWTDASFVRFDQLKVKN